MNDKFLTVNNLPEEVTLLADTGFKGIEKFHSNTLLPKKKNKNNPLSKKDKEINWLISSVRVKVEHTIGGMKRFRAFSDIFRNKNGIDDKMNLVIAGL